MSEVRTSRPRQVIVEITVIVGSILLAFAIDAWWGASQESRRIEGALASLESGLRASLGQLDEEENRLEVYRSRLEAFRTMDPARVQEIPEADAFLLVESIHRPIVTTLNIDFLAALLDTDDLRNVADESLQLGIAEWRRAVAGVRHRRDALLSVEQQAYAALNRGEAARLRISEAPEASSTAALEAALTNEEVLAVAATKAVNWGILGIMYDELRGSTVSLIALLEARR